MPKFRADTRASMVQASSAKLLQLLHEIYPEILTFEEKENTRDGLLSSQEAQTSLISYLNFRQDPEQKLSAEKIKQAYTNPNIAATIQLIDLIHEIPDEKLPQDSKKAIFAMMKVIALSYPGEQWDENHRQWNMNCFYNVATGKDDCLLTPSPP